MILLTKQLVRRQILSVILRLVHVKASSIGVPSTSQTAPVSLPVHMVAILEVLFSVVNVSKVCEQSPCKATWQPFSSQVSTAHLSQRLFSKSYRFLSVWSGSCHVKIGFSYSWHSVGYCNSSHSFCLFLFCFFSFSSLCCIWWASSTVSSRPWTGVCSSDWLQHCNNFKFKSITTLICILRY